MDKFEERFNEIMQMSKEDRNKAIRDLEVDCVCPICPTYNQCAKNAQEKLFCIIGSSKECITKERGCMCPNCPIAGIFGIGVKYNFYCTRDSEMEQRKI